MLVNGEWARDFQPRHSTSENGDFIREESRFRNWITADGSSGFKAEKGRYHLFAALICPWASRTLMVRKLKRLDDVVSLTILDPRVTEKVWRFGRFADSFPGSEADPLYGSHYLYEIYLRAKSDYTGEITVPVLWDKKLQTIVNNESSEIIRMFNSGFGELADNSIDLYPSHFRAEIDHLNEQLYDRFNNGVYRAGFAESQSAYESAVSNVFSTLDEINQLLEGQQYLIGNQLTETDIRTFVTLIRFEAAYYGLFKTNLHHLYEYPNIRRYVETIYHLPGIAETVNIEHIKAGYYSIKDLNPSGIVPVGPESLW